MGLRDLAPLASLLGDPTRCTLMELMLDNPVTIDYLAKKASISRTAVEKHISILTQYGLIERRAPSVGRLRYFYYVTDSGETFLEAFRIAAENYASYRLSEVSEELQRLNKAKEFGILTDTEIKLEFDRLNEMREKLLALLARGENSK